MWETYPGMPACHYSKLIGEKWRSMTEDQRQPWYDAAKESIQTYQKEIAEEMKQNNGKKLPTLREYKRLKEQLQKGSLRRKAFGAQIVSGQKKELSPYIRFYTMRVKQMINDKRPVKEKMQDVVAEWKTLT